MASISPTQSDVQAALGAFLEAILPGTPSVWSSVFAGFISGGVLTVTKNIAGVISPGAQILGAASGTVVVSQSTGQRGQTGTYQISPSQTLGSETSTRTMSTGVDVLTGQQNRTAEPSNPYFILMTPVRFERLSTNVDVSQDCKFVASISGTEMNVSSVDDGEIEIGNLVFGPGLAAGTIVTGFGTGSGGVGTYNIAPSQTVNSEIMSAGTKVMTQNARIVVQLEFQGAGTAAGDFAQTVSTALRDEFGVDFFANLAAPLNGVVPLYADDPHQVAFINAENQFEWRWVLDAHLEVQQTVTVPQTYADSASVDVVGVEAEFPPA